MRLAIISTMALLAVAVARAGDEPGAVPVGWKIKKGERFAASWESSGSGRGRAEDRDVQMEWTAPADVDGAGRLDVIVKSVRWTVEADGYRIDAAWARGEPVKATVEPPEAAADARAAADLDDMKRAIAGEVHLEIRPGAAGAVAFFAPKEEARRPLFPDFALHPPLPPSGARLGARVPIDRAVLRRAGPAAATGTAECKVTAVTEKSVTFAAADRRGEERVQLVYRFARQGFLASADRTYASAEGAGGAAVRWQDHLTVRRLVPAERRE